MSRKSQNTSAEAQLKNVRIMIQLWQNNLLQKNELFAGSSQPPKMYVDDYEQSTTELNELQNKEKLLEEQLSEDNSSDPNDDRLDNHRGYHNSDLQYSPLSRQNEFDFNNLPKPVNNFSNLNDLNFAGASLSSNNNTPPTPKSPFRATIRVQLPYHQSTIVPLRPGLSLKESFLNAMNRRGLRTEMCDIEVKNQNCRLDWNDDIAYYEGLEMKISIKKGAFPYTPSISHNFTRKTFFRTSCNVCDKALFQAFRCQTCGFKFHQRCAISVPPLCEPLRIHSANYTDIYYHHMLAGDDLDKNEKPSNDHQHLKPDSRSTSEPNVFKVNKNLAHPIKEEHLNSPHTVVYKTFQSNNNPRDYPSIPLPSISGLQNSLANARIYSAGGSPTSSFAVANEQTNAPQLNNQSRPRARSADESSNKKLIVNQKCRSCTTYNSNCDQCTNATKIANQRTTGENWEIKPDEILTGPKIGSGSFGTVYRGYWHCVVALKKLNVKNPSPMQLKAFKNEVAVLNKTRHVNVLLFMGFSKDDQLTIVTQWCEGSSLFKHLHVLEHTFELQQCMDIARQIAQGMNYLHAKNIIHRDLKSQNIFLQEDLTTKIGDFGLATVKTKWNGPHQFNHPTGSILWMAPEIVKMKDSDAFSFKSDIYAYGIVLFEIFAGELPYRRGPNNQLDNQSVLYLVAMNKLTPDLSRCRRDTPKTMIKLTQDCLEFDREKRPLFEQVLSSIELSNKSIPKINRSFSEPALNSNQTDILEHMGFANSPTTPISHSRFKSHFHFYQ